MKATEFMILRDVRSNSRISCDVPKKPRRVATLINEEKFRASGNELLHLDTVFLEEFLHDWMWKDGRFSYTSRVAECADVVLVYETDES